MKINFIGLYLLALGVFLILDGIWLGLVAKNLYASQLKGLMTDNVKWGAAALFYLLFIGFLIYFAINPALQAQSLSLVIQKGALFGLATYATYDLTNYATLKGFPLKIVIIDLLWGTFISGSVATITYILYTKFVS